MDTLRQDLRFALRLLWKDRAFTATAILTLALCIGANTAIFTVVRSVLLRPLPYPEADRLIYAVDRFPGAGVDRAGTSILNYLERQRDVPAFESQALHRQDTYTIGDPGSVEGVTGMRVTPSFFHVLRVSTHRGRVFTEDEATPGRDRFVIVSYGYWRRALAGRDDAIGRHVRIDGEPYVVVGVMPDGFTFLNPNVQIWLPLTITKEMRSEDSRYSQNHDVVGRLAPGATIAQAQQQVDAKTRRDIDRAGPLKDLLINAGYHTTVFSLEADVVRDVRRALYLLWGGVLFVLLIAAANITNLVLVRASGRMKELATRHALGAGHARMARQLLTETLVLTAIGAAIGLALGYWGLGWLSSTGLDELPRGHEIQMDWIVVTFTVGVAIAQGLLISIVPLAQLAGLNLNLVLREDGRTGTAGRGTGLVRRGLVTAQVALAFVLLIGAGLLFESFRQILAVDPGFKAEHVLTGEVTLHRTRYDNDSKQNAFMSRALDGIRRLPGIAAAGAASDVPFGEGTNSSVVVPEGYVIPPGESIISPNQLWVTPGFFEALGMQLRQGRLFNETDTAEAPLAIIVDDRLAKRFWPNADPLGKRLFLPQRPEDLQKPPADARWMHVVGVVTSIRQQTLVEGEQARLGAYYMPYPQNPLRNFGFVIKTTGDPMQAVNAVRKTIGSLDPELVLDDVTAMPQRIERSIQSRRTPMLLSMGFGVVALLLASVGIYGVLAYQVSQRTREIGIRMTLGSDASSILRLILREGATLVVIGLVIGGLGTLALRQVIASQLYGVGALDPMVLLSVSGLLAVAALFACFAPARRASRVDPVVALTQR